MSQSPAISRWVVQNRFWKKISGKQDATNRHQEPLTTPKPMVVLCGKKGSKPKLRIAIQGPSGQSSCIANLSQTPGFIIVIYEGAKGHRCMEQSHGGSEDASGAKALVIPAVAHVGTALR